MAGRLEAAVKHLVLSMGMSQQLSSHFLKQAISFPMILAVRDAFDKRRHYLVVIVQVLQDSFCDAEHFFEHRECLSLRGDLLGQHGAASSVSSCWKIRPQLARVPPLGVAARYLLNRRLNTCIPGVWDGLIRFSLAQTDHGRGSVVTGGQSAFARRARRRAPEREEFQRL